MEAPEFLLKMDWELLKKQKQDLMKAMTIVVCNDAPNSIILDSLEGILNLIDAMQDFAVDAMGVDEDIVFDLDKEEYAMTKEIRFAKAMSELLFTMRNESDANVDDVSKERADAIAADPVHITEIKLRIFKHVYEDVCNFPQNFQINEETGEYEYTTDVYDYGFSYDNYIENLVEKERQSKLKTKYKVWIEVERIDTDEEGNEEYSDCDFPVGIAYVDTFEEAQALQQNIANIFGEL